MSQIKLTCQGVTPRPYLQNRGIFGSVACWLRIKAIGKVSHECTHPKQLSHIVNRGLARENVHVSWRSCLNLVTHLLASRVERFDSANGTGFIRVLSIGFMCTHVYTQSNLSEQPLFAQASFLPAGVYLCARTDD